MRSFVAAVLAGLFGAALVHIVVVLATPSYATRDVWSKVQRLGETGAFHRLESAPAVIGLPNRDPFLRSAVCVFDASHGPIHVTAGDAAGTPSFWSLAVFDTDGSEVYSMNDRSAVERRVDVVLATPTQMLRLRRSRPEALATSILVALPGPKGYVALRTSVDDPSWDETAKRFLDGAHCAAVDAS
ncbi:DUF1254 domain-containing protein [Pararhizobium mangrovi]|uniref:DUF1254 domain-containing protein n=1 Tax=Pararhizobium mangrovi TaxID=2590452 RepID=A0A506UHE3_9HYPH|nr:DUF1254 domain-containing protein [Pararhizobium mangrovi]TPW32733.1 DUF1254 domain-containing protein [Pararhizobium mangrovi]